ncbi:MAG: NAD(P)-dependent oxidoreductase [Nostoc sp.]|uniref:NAD-dependent epimerase/dehydratase family protein n=1 Tax=Nostoc sp. TaxID=1180 RepID=UPI002FF7ACA8
MSKILITGSSGFIGTSLTSYLINNKYEVLGIDKQLPTDKSHEPYFLRCDILDAENLEKVIQEFSPNVILHLAARIDLDEKYDIKGYEANIQGVENLINTIRRTSSVKRCIFTSSQLVCKVGYIPKDEFDYAPHTLYGESKVLTEKIVREQDGGGAEWSLVRPTTVWGPGMSPHYQNFLKMIETGRYFHVGKRPLYKSYSYVGNIVYQYHKLMEATTSQIHRQTFYLADYEPISLREWVNAFQIEFGADPIRSYPEGIVNFLAHIGNLINNFGFKSFPFNTFRQNNILTEYVFDLSKTKEVCGQLPYTTEQGIKETVKWLLSK